MDSTLHVESGFAAGFHRFRSGVGHFSHYDQGNGTPLRGGAHGGEKHTRMSVDDLGDKTQDLVISGRLPVLAPLSSSQGESRFLCPEGQRSADEKRKSEEGEDSPSPQ